MTFCLSNFSFERDSWPMTTKPTVQDFLNEFAWLLDTSKHATWSVRYGWTNRCDPWEAPHQMDCSGSGCGIINRLMQSHGTGSYPCQGSFAMARRAHQLGLGISIEEARTTPGAMLFIGANQGQGAIDGSKDGVWPGHVGYSTGTGKSTAEARGHVLGCGYFPWSSGRWDWASKPFPELSTASSVPVPPSEPEIDEQRFIEMILMPNTNTTPHGEIASARIVGPPFNFVLLESGARVAGDRALTVAKETRFWKPADSVVNQKDSEIIGCFLVPREKCAEYGLPEKRDGYLVARYVYGNQDTGTYLATVQT